MSFPKDNAYELRLKMKGKGRRWVEKYYMGNAGAAQYSTFQAYAKQIGLARRLCLALDFAIEDAALHTLGSTPDRKFVSGCIGGPFALDTESGGVEACNNPTVCLNTIFETPQGAWANRQIRALRDGWITGDALTFSPTIPSAGTGVLDADLVAGKTKEVALGLLLHTIRERSMLLFIPDPTAVPVLYDQASFDTILPGYVSHRDTGVGRLFRGRAPKIH